MASRPDDISRPRRSTFAFDVSAPVQGSPQSGASFRGGSIVGGRSAGVNASPQAQGGANLAPVLGQFADKLLEPWAKAEAQKRFIKGMTDQMYAEAGHEVRAEGILPKIFGPSAYEEGAIFYEAQQRVAQAQTEWQADEAELRKLPPNEVAKAWSQKLQQTLTGNALTDQAIQTSMLEASGPMLQSVAKARYAWQQEETVKQQQSAWSSMFSALQAQALSFNSTGDPSKEQSQGLQAAVQNVSSALVMPYGQDPASYKKSIATAYQTALQSGQGYAVSIMEQAGILDILDPKDRIAMEDRGLRYKARAAADFIAHDEATQRAISEYNGLMAMENLNPATAMSELRKINQMVVAGTGFDGYDFFDANDQKSANRTAWEGIAAAQRRDENRAFELQKEQAREARADQRDALKATVDASIANAAIHADTPAVAAMQSGAKSDATQAALYRALEGGEYGVVANAFGSGMEIGNTLKMAMQNPVAAAIGSGYSDDFKRVHAHWEGLFRANPATAKELFGKFAPNMMNYDRQIANHATPEIAFTMAFSDDTVYTPSGQEVRTANKDVLEWVHSNAQPGWLIGNGIDGTAINDSGERELANAISRTVAVDGKFAGGALSKEAQVKTAFNQMISNGQIEKAGPMLWSNRPGTRPIYALIGGTKKEASDVITAIVDSSLRRAGFKEGAYGDEYRIVRGKADGEDILQVTPVDDNGLNISQTVVIPISAFKAGLTNYRLSKAGKYIPSRDAQKLRSGGLQGNQTDYRERAERRRAYEARLAAKRRSGLIDNVQQGLILGAGF